jgi:hypothetical protein
MVAFRMIIIGGDSPNGYTSAAELKGDKLDVFTSVLFPYVPLAWHCTSQMDSLTLAVTGGYATKNVKDCSQKSYFYHLATKTWTDGPLMIAQRAEHGCSFISGKDGKPTAIVVGGYVNAALTRLDSVEIYNRALDKWESGPALPDKLSAFQVK